jgi:predicted ATPase
MSQNINQQNTLHANIPFILTSFIGRHHEIAEVMQLLGSSRLLTLTGAAGCGKTRLALRAAADVSHQYTHGVYWVELARLTDPQLVPKAVAKAVNVPEQRDRSLVSGLVDTLHDKQLLLVLDNCEHVLSTCSRLVETLLSSTSVSILATSREPLSVTGEMLYPVAPMSLPPVSLRPDEIGQFDAIQLFVERARAMVPPFELLPHNANVIASICHHLDGIPLAIELASARVNVLTVEQIAARLDDRFALLATAPHLTRSHHHTLRAAIDWSYDLLSAPEQVMLQRLSVFAGGCSLTTVEKVCVGDSIEREKVLDLLSSLVNRSLVIAQTLHRSEARYSLLETIRQYGQEKLRDAEEWAQMCDQHLLCFLQLTEEAEPKTKGQYQQLWLNWLGSVDI